ncbi:MAG: metal ABC transporter substrate-binding protein [Chloroflexota bacterium]
MIKRNQIRILFYLLLVVFIFSACSGDLPQSDDPFVLATTTIVGDVASQIGGELMEVRVLLPPDVDPHSFQPTPQDLVAIEQAELVLTNGFGLEEFLGEMIEDTASADKIVEVSLGVSPIYFGENADKHGVDPHVWMSPLNVVVWVENIASALAELDPVHTAEYQANAQAYQEELEDLHNWALDQFDLVPEDQRLLVADHETFNYLARAYGFDVVGALTGFSSLAESSAQELAALEDAIMDLGVPAIFVSTTVPPGLAEQVAEDTGIKVVRVYTGSLSAEDGPAANYIELLRNTISLMVDALR